MALAGARSALVRHEQRGQPGVVGGDQEAVDQPRPGRRVGERGDDHELVALATMTRSTGSVSSADRRSTDVRGSTRTTRARVPGSPETSPASATRSPTTTLRAAELAGPHRGHRAVPDQGPVAAAVHRGHERLGRVLVRGPAPGPWPGALRRPDPDVILVQVGVGRPPVQGARSSIAAHTEVKPGNVLPTVAAFSTRRPGTARPSTAAAITSR